MMESAELKKEIFRLIVFIFFVCFLGQSPGRTQTLDSQKLMTSKSDSDGIKIIKIANSDPFHAETEMIIKVESSCRVHISICTPMGATVRNLASSGMKAGLYTIKWDGKDDSGSPVGSGVYIVNVQSQHCQKNEALALL